MRIKSVTQAMSLYNYIKPYRTSYPGGHDLAFECMLVNKKTKATVQIGTGSTEASAIRSLKRNVEQYGCSP